MGCLATDALQLHTVILLVALIAAVLIAYELWSIRLLQRGLAAERGVMLPFPRTLVATYVFLILVQWSFVMIRSAMSESDIDNSQDRVQQYASGKMLLTKVSAFMGLVVFTSWGVAVLTYLASDSAGRATIRRSKQYSVVHFFLATFAFGASQTISKYKWHITLGYRSLLLVGVTAVAVASFLRIRFYQRSAVRIIALYFAFSLAVETLFYLDFVSAKISIATKCWHQTLLVLNLFVTPIALFTAFRIDAAYWRRIAHRDGFSGELARDMLEPLVEQLFPSSMVLDYNAFTTTAVLGKGSQATVFRVKYRNDDVEYAMKQYSLEEVTDRVVDTFLSEVFLLFGIQHPNVLELKGVCIAPPYLCVVTELCDSSLYHVLKRRRMQRSRLNWSDIQAISLNIAEGMTYLHERQIIHRDLKSLNVLMKFCPQQNRILAKVADMGCSRIFDPDYHPRKPQKHAIRLVRRKYDEIPLAPSNSSSRSPGGWFSGSSAVSHQLTSSQLTGAVGTIPWVAPEVLLPNRFYDSKCDVFSMGVVLWELTTCDEPITDTRNIRALDCVRGYRLPTLQVLPREMVALIEACWAEDPSERPSFPEVLQRLRTLKQKDLGT